MKNSEIVKVGLYEHYKGKRYRVFGMARHSETLEMMVHYECLYENEMGRIWVRPADNFTSTVTIEGVECPRFRFISDTV